MPFCRDVCDNAAFESGDYTTAFIEKEYGERGFKEEDAFLRLRGDGAGAGGLELGALREFMAPSLSKYKLPTVLHVVDAIPKNATAAGASGRPSRTLGDPGARPVGDPGASTSSRALDHTLSLHVTPSVSRAGRSCSPLRPRRVPDRLPGVKGAVDGGRPGVGPRGRRRGGGP